MTEALGQQGEFRLLHKIGEGGMADVFLAERLGDDGFRTRVALKRLHRGLAMDTYFIRQLVREARLLGQLEHANIVRVYDLKRIGDEYYVVMEFVDGIDLAQVIKVHRTRKTRIPRPFFFHVALSLAEALAYAHSAVDEEGKATPLIHRDIKPSNVMLSRRGIVKLTDFGIAHVGDGSVTGGLVQGTANYMSPEQAFGEERLKAASDVYSLGSVFYEMLSGKPLIDADNYLKAIHITRERRVTLEELAGLGVEPGLRMVIAKMLSADTSGRYQEMESVRNDLQFVADRLKIDLSWHRIRAYVGRLMGILGRAPNRATLSNLSVPESVRQAAQEIAQAPQQLGPTGPTTPATPPPVDMKKLGPPTQAVEKDMLESQLAALSASQMLTPKPRPPVDDLGLDSESPITPPFGNVGPATPATPAHRPVDRGADTMALPGAAAAGGLGRDPAEGLPDLSTKDPNRTMVYRGKSPSEMGVMGTTGEHQSLSKLPALDGLAPASSQSLEASPAMAEFAGAAPRPRPPPPAPLSRPPPVAPPPAPPAARPPPAPAPPRVEEPSEEEWVFDGGGQEDEQTLAAEPADAPQVRRRRKKRRKKRKSQAVYVLVALIVVMVLVLGMLFGLAMKKGVIGSLAAPAETRVVSTSVAPGWGSLRAEEPPPPGHGAQAT